MQEKKQELSLIVAHDRNRVIGVNGRLPWRLSSDLRNFKRLTLDNTVIMGRKTFESIGKALPQRQNIVISKTLKKPISNITIARSLEEALLISESKKCFFIGGSEVYKSTINIIDSMYLTLVDTCSRGDTVFPKIDIEEWFILFETRYKADSKNEYGFTVKKFIRKI